MDLSQLRSAEGSTKNKKRRGRGEGSGSGVTAGRGHKGYGSRGGSKKRAWFEGGQMPLQRRLPKFGFTNNNKVPYQVVNLDALEQFKDVKTITSSTLKDANLIRKAELPVKILGDGKLESKINVEVNAISKSAREKIEKLGGSVTLK